MHGKGTITVVCAGTSDLPVAEEAAVTAEIMGNYVERIADVGVAGLHRLLGRLEVALAGDGAEEIFDPRLSRPRGRFLGMRRGIIEGQDQRNPAAVIALGGTVHSRNPGPNLAGRRCNHLNILRRGRGAKSRT